MAKAAFVVWAFRRVDEAKGMRLDVGFDSGIWTIESGRINGGGIQRMEVDPEQMDAFVREWPKLREAVKR